MSAKTYDDGKGGSHHVEYCDWQHNVCKPDMVATQILRRAFNSVCFTNAEIDIFALFVRINGKSEYTSLWNCDKGALHCIVVVNEKDMLVSFHDRKV